MITLDSTMIYPLAVLNPSMKYVLIILVRDPSTIAYTSREYLIQHVTSVQGTWLFGERV